MKKGKKLATALVSGVIGASMLLQSCAGLNKAYEATKKFAQENTEEIAGTVLGAGGAAILTKIFGGDGKDVAIASGVGAAIGGLSGHAYKKYKAEKLQEALAARKGLTAQLNANGEIQVNAVGDLSFASGKFNLKEPMKAGIKNVADVLTADDKALKEAGYVRIIKVEGHTDADGSEAYNQALSEKRAVAIKNELVANGISADTIVTEGCGETKPVASNETREGKSKNRRAEIKIQYVDMAELVKAAKSR